MKVARKFKIHSGSGPQRAEPLPPDDILRERYFLSHSLRSFAFWHGLDQHAAIKLLKKIGIDIYEEVAREWERGTPIRELNRRHGVGRDTISRWIKNTGRRVTPANCRKRYDEKLLVEVWRQTGSCNKAAQAAGVSWGTANAALRELDLRVDSP